MTGELYTVFGGSGFVGRYIVQLLAAQGHRIRVAVRHPDQALFLKPAGAVGQVVPIAADVKNEASVARAVEGADGVINLVGILYAHGSQGFDAVQVKGAALVAQEAAKAGAKRLVHMSAIGADLDAAAKYARSKAAGEKAVLDAFPAATVLRPSLIFGPEDQFFNRFASLARLSPIMPVFMGKTKFQPVYVRDVAEAAVKSVTAPGFEGRVFELGGPCVYRFKELLRYILDVTYRKRLLLDIPTPFAKIDAALLGLLPKPMLTLDQLKMLERDNVVAKDALGFEALAIEPTPVEAVIPTQLTRYRVAGRFTHRPDAV